MPPKKKPKAVVTTSQPPKQKESNTSRTDLSNLTLRDLIALRGQVDAALADIYSLSMTQDDVLLEYNIKLKTKDGTVSENIGNVQMNKLLHPRLLGDSPSRFQQQFAQQVYAPVNAALFDLLDKHNTTDNDIYALDHEYGPSAGLPAPIDSSPDDFSQLG